MDSSKTRAFVSALWDEQIVPQLVEYIRIPNKSPMFDAQWVEHGYMDKVVAQFEKEYLSRVIGRANGNMSKAARLASIDRTTLYRLLDKHGLQRDELSGPGCGHRLRACS